MPFIVIADDPGIQGIRLAVKISLSDISLFIKGQRLIKLAFGIGITFNDPAVFFNRIEMIDGQMIDLSVNIIIFKVVFRSGLSGTSHK